MTTLDVSSVRLSECALAADAHLAVARTATSTIHYCFRGTGFILLEDEAPIRLTPHTLVIVPPGRAMTITAAAHPATLRTVGKRNGRDFTLGSLQRHSVGHGAPTLVLACGSFRANYGPALDLFASLATAVVERFDVHDQLDQVMSYAMAELTAQHVGGGAMSAALLKLVLLALLRRCLVSTNPWVERFAILSDPPIARAFAAMTSRLSVPHTVQSLAQAVGLSRSAFMARFSAAFGESPMSLLRRVRMRHAADLLAANALSIDQVALNAGYQSRSSFTRTFRRYYGSDPSEYRAKAQRAFSERVTPAEDMIEESDAGGHRPAAATA
ncbi:AraC family transcriptional regulator [Bradyrhizobium sp. LHD-71]|uniref:AraC family transcriptional regulator n=1 Tax=Bradyrhizobium sp. LHD-71 TaxID=3072141 RepID=UPI00280CC6C1|nr:AraC family transcriptional regulator [Bradyrhizobium sp. LHD-71]MDQ8727595.1 AraC family transcriptional regulator [Bradyrhizobium sp. LHD-71]